MARHDERIRKLFADVQFGIGIRGGSEIIFHRLTELLWFLLGA